MQLSFKPYSLNLKHTFTVSSYSRTTTPIVLVEIKWEEETGYGEALLPPYLGETQESVISFFTKSKLKAIFQSFSIRGYFDICR